LNTCFNAVSGDSAVDNVPVEPHDVFKAAILNNTKSIIAFHNFVKLLLSRVAEAIN
jgi:hypothetical protein